MYRLYGFFSNCMDCYSGNTLVSFKFHSIQLYVQLSVYPSLYLSACLQFIYLFIYPICLSVYLYVYVSIGFSVYLSLSICLSVYLSVCLFIRSENILSSFFRLSENLFIFDRLILTFFNGVCNPCTSLAQFHLP